MVDFLSSRDLARRTAAAVDAAVGAGRELGLTVTDATVLHDLFSVVVHLAPTPVVARVPTVRPRREDLTQRARAQQRELDVAQWLADRGTPVIPPSPRTPREPVRRDGFAMTFWQFVEPDRTTEPDYVANTEVVPELHAALRDYPGPLDFLGAAEPHLVDDHLDLLATRPDLLDPADLDRARREWRALAPLVRSRAAFEHAFPGIDLQPIHGDSPPANLFHAADGHRHTDFELVCLGPVEWDVATLGPDFAAAYDRGARRCGRRPLDEKVKTFVDAVGRLRAITSLALAPQLPVLTEYLTPAVEHWRETPFAGGVVTP